MLSSVYNKAKKNWGEFEEGHKKYTNPKNLT